MSGMAIETENLRFGYPRRPVFPNLTVSVPQGVACGLLGPNAAGKTTLMNLLNGFYKPDSGRIRVLGLDPWKERVALQRRLAFVPEHPFIYPWMRVGDFLVFYARCFPSWDGALARERLEAAKIPMKARFQTLSRGQQGRVSLETALARHADLLLLDDPTLGLDVDTRRALYRSLVAELADREVTVFFATHLPAEVEGLLTHVIFLREGRVSAQGDIEAMKEQHAGPEGRPSLEDLYMKLATEDGHAA